MAEWAHFGPKGRVPVAGDARAFLAARPKMTSVLGSARTVRQYQRVIA